MCYEMICVRFLFGSPCEIVWFCDGCFQWPTPQISIYLLVILVGIIPLIPLPVSFPCSFGHFFKTSAFLPPWDPTEKGNEDVSVVPADQDGLLSRNGETVTLDLREGAKVSGLLVF